LNLRSAKPAKPVLPYIKAIESDLRFT